MQLLSSAAVAGELPQTMCKMNEQGPVPMKLYLWTLKFKFHFVFTYHTILFFF